MCWPELGRARPAFSAWSCPVLPGPVWSCLAVFGSWARLPMIPPLGPGPGHQAEVAWFLHSGGQVTREVAESLCDPAQPLLLLGHLQRVLRVWFPPTITPMCVPSWALSGSSRPAMQLVWGLQEPSSPDSSPDLAWCPESLPRARPGLVPGREGSLPAAPWAPSLPWAMCEVASLAHSGSWSCSAKMSTRSSSCNGPCRSCRRGRWHCQVRSQRSASVSSSGAWRRCGPWCSAPWGFSPASSTRQWTGKWLRAHPLLPHLWCKKILHLGRAFDWSPGLMRQTLSHPTCVDKFIHSVLLKDDHKIWVCHLT